MEQFIESRFLCGIYVVFVNFNNSFVMFKLVFHFY